MYNYAKLKGRIIEICGTQACFAKEMGVSERTMTLKLQQKIFFRQNEIEKAITILRLSTEDIQNYFFCHLSSEKPNLKKA